MSGSGSRVVTSLGLLALLLSAHPLAALEGPAEADPQVLLVTAHPDDELAFAASVSSGSGAFSSSTRWTRPTEDAGTVLTRQWDAAAVGKSLREILERGRYGFVFVPLPTATTHGAHQAAAVLALEAVASLPEGRRPAVPPDRPVLEFDRTGKLGHQARLDYRIVVNWVIAEHKSQGLTQTLMNADDVELYYLFALNGPTAVAAAQALFDRLAGAREALGQRVTEPYLGRYSGVCLMDR